MKKIILAPLLLAFLFLLPTSTPNTHGQLVGKICLTTPGSSSCPTSPPTLTGTAGSQLRVAVFIQGSDTLNGFDIILLADHNILKPADADTTGTVLPAPLTIVSKCVGGVAFQGNCSPQASSNPDTLGLAVVSNGGFATAPVTGLLFTAIYNITSTTTGTSIAYQMGCANGSVSGTTDCVQLANGTITPVPETVQAATFSNILNPDFALSASPASITVKRGASATSTITISPINGFTGVVNLSASINPQGRKTPTASLASPSVTITTGQATDILSVNTPNGGTTGTYTVTVTGTSGNLAHSVAITVTVTK